MRAYSLLIIMVLKIMDDKTPHQILIENIEYIHKLIQKINYQKNLKLCDEDIEDIFQNISIKLLDKGIAQFQGKSKFQTYLFTIVRNEVLEYVRIHSKEYSESKFKNDDNDDEDVAEQYRYLFSQHSGITIIDYVDLMVRKDIVHIIDTTLDTFDDKDKLIFTWYFLCKLTQNKIAHMIKLSQPSVAERIEKIRKRIIDAVMRKYPELDKELKS